MSGLPNAGRFRWKQRMGVHEAYHRNGVNRLLHWLCIPLELWAVIKLASLVPLAPAYGVDLAVVLIVVTAPIYLLTDPLLGGVMVSFLAACCLVAHRVLPASPLAGALLAVALFAFTFGAQVKIGHGVYEEGRDDTEKNLAELVATRNPIPLLLVFYYHLVELALMAGYRPRLRRDIEAFSDLEAASSPRSLPGRGG